MWNKASATAWKRRGGAAALQEDLVPGGPGWTEEHFWLSHRLVWFFTLTLGVLMREQGQTCALLRTLVLLGMKIQDASQLAVLLTGSGLFPYRKSCTFVEKV